MCESVFPIKPWVCGFWMRPDELEYRHQPRKNITHTAHHASVSGPESQLWARDRELYYSNDVNSN